MTDEHRFNLNLLAEAIAYAASSTLAPQEAGEHEPAEVISGNVNLAEEGGQLDVATNLLVECRHVAATLNTAPHEHKQIRWINHPSEADNPEGLIGRFVGRASSTPIPTVEQLVAWNEAMSERVVHRHTAPEDRTGLQQKLMFSEDLRFGEDNEEAVSQFLLSVRDSMETDGAKHVEVFWRNIPSTENNPYGEVGFYAAVLLREPQAALPA